MPRTRSMAEAASPLQSLPLTTSRKPRKKTHRAQPPSPPSSVDEPEHSQNENSENKIFKYLPHTTLPLQPATSRDASTQNFISQSAALQESCAQCFCSSASSSSSSQPMNYTDSGSQITEKIPEDLRQLTRLQLIDIIVSLRASEASASNTGASTAIVISASKKRSAPEDTEDVEPMNLGHTSRRRRIGSSSPPRRILPRPNRSRNTQPRRFVGDPSKPMHRFMNAMANIPEPAEEMDSDDEGLSFPTRTNDVPSTPLFPGAGSSKYIAGNADRFRESKPQNEHSSPGQSSHAEQQQETALTTIPENVPETPRNRGWGFSALVNSVPRSIARFLPTRRYTPESTTATTQATESNTNTDSTTLQESPATPKKQTTNDTQQPRTEPHQRRRAETPRAPSTAGSSNRLSKTHKAANPKRKPDDRARIEREYIAAEGRRVQEEDARKAREAKELEQRRQEEAKTTVGQKRKRVSLDVIPHGPPDKPSTFMLDYDYFVSSDEDSDEEMEGQSTSTAGDKRVNDDSAGRPSKRARVSEGDDQGSGFSISTSRTLQTIPQAQTPRQVVGDPHRAQPYTGTFFADNKGQIPYKGGNVFDESEDYNIQKANLSKRTATQKKAIEKEPFKEPGKNRGFSCNFSEDDDSGDDVMDEGQKGASKQQEHGQIKATAVPDKTSSKARESSCVTSNIFAQAENKGQEDSSTKPTTSPKKSAIKTTSMFDNTSSPSTISGVNTEPSINGTPQATGNATSAANPPITWTQEPPSRPTPAHASLPAELSNGTGNGEALARARSQAEKYKPKQPSGLRASSRLSASTIGSDIRDDKDEENMDPEVAAAVAALPRDHLPKFIWPKTKTFEQMGYDPEVIAAIDAAWGERDTAKAKIIFDEDLKKWAAEKKIILSQALLS
ncbi:MAG: hypothetical protein M1827_005300 [Pycnora praestabilis]|nr:MAG: hypothetical protein M1827_005300 [Pycnora praestabilis]